MSWCLRDRRGPEWKQDWTSQTLSSISLPPPTLLVFFAIVVLFLSLSKYMDYREELHKTGISFRFLLLVIPVVLIFIVRSLPTEERFGYRCLRREHDMVGRAWSFPWGVAALVVLLLVMISYESSFQSRWFRPLWKSYY